MTTKKRRIKAPVFRVKPVTVDNIREFVQAMGPIGVTNNHIAHQFRIPIEEASREMRFLWRGGWVKRVAVEPSERVPCGLSWQV